MAQVRNRITGLIGKSTIAPGYRKMTNLQAGCICRNMRVVVCVLTASPQKLRITSLSVLVVTTNLRNSKF